MLKNSGLRNSSRRRVTNTPAGVVPHVGSGGGQSEEGPRLLQQHEVAAALGRDPADPLKVLFRVDLKDLQKKKKNSMSFSFHLISLLRYVIMNDHLLLILRNCNIVEVMFTSKHKQNTTHATA